MAEKEYQRLTWSRMRRTGLFTAFATRSSLWLGKDHLLCLDSSGYAEEYKRFYFRDIQAVSLVANNHRVVWNWVLGVPLAGCVGAWIVDLVATEGMSTVGMITGIVITLLFAVPLLLNNLFGPTCACQVRTAVQTEVLPSLNRLRRARKVINRIRPLIEAAQGASLTPEEVAGTLANPAAPNTPPVIASYRTAPAPAPVAPRYYAGTVHLILFWLLLADVPLTAVNVAYESTGMDLASALLLLITLGYAIAALIKQHNTSLSVGLKRLPWFVLGWGALMLVAALAYGMVLAVKNPEAMRQSFSPLEDPVVLVMTLISTAGTAAMGVAGLVLLRKFRAFTPSPAPAPPVADSSSAT